MKYKVMFWLMCFFAYVCIFWLLPLTHDDSFSYLAVVLQVHAATFGITLFAWGFSGVAHKAFKNE
jgi:hypothetical protein